jgi:hypothetical protein
MNRRLPAALLSIAIAGTASAQNKVDIVKVVGCLRGQGPNSWTLVAATEPEISNANAPPRAEVPTEAPPGKNEFRLIGVGEFNLPAYKDHTVVVKALFIKAMPTSRLNITSVTDALPTCAPSAPK